MSAANGRNLFWPVTTLVLAVALLIGGFFWVSQSTLLAVEQIDISGNHSLSEEELMTVLEPRLKGRSLLQLSYNDTVEALKELPVVKDVEISRDFPHTLRVEIFEYRPVACYAGAGGDYFLSDDGRVLTMTPDSDTKLPVLRTQEACAAEVGGRIECQDVMTGIDFLISVPVNLHQEFTNVSVLDGIIDASTLSGLEVHFGTMEEYAYKFEVLRQLIARSIAAGEQVIIDVSVPDRPVTRDKNTPGLDTPADTDADAPAADSNGEVVPEEAYEPAADYVPDETAALE